MVLLCVYLSLALSIILFAELKYNQLEQQVAVVRARKPSLSLFIFQIAFEPKR